MIVHQANMDTYVHPVRSCIFRVRMRYLLPAPVSKVFLRLFPSSQVVINAFSQMVPGAKDHFTINNGCLHISGVIGDPCFSVIYDRRNIGLVAALCELENVLVQAGYGHVSYGVATSEHECFT